MQIDELDYKKNLMKIENAGVLFPMSKCTTIYFFFILLLVLNNYSSINFRLEEGQG